MPIFASPLFTANYSTSSYLFVQSRFSNEFTTKQNICLPLVHDSEWYDDGLAQFLNREPIINRYHLSTQVKHIFDKPVCFFTDTAIAQTGNSFLLPMHNDFVVCDYLEQFGIKSTVELDESDENETKSPYLDIWLYSFFTLVDIGLLAKKDSLIYKYIKELIGDGQIKHDKRLATNWNKPVSLPIIFTLYDVDNNPHKYRLRLFFIDIGALHGNKGYKTVCENVGIDTSKKSLMDNYKSDMLTGLKLYPDEFIAYANGDLYVYDVLEANNNLFKQVYNDLGLIDFFIPPKLTIGSTVADIVSSAIFKWKNLSADDYHAKINKKLKRKTVLNGMMELSSSQYLKTQLVKSHLYLCGKVQGGRCHNNNPLFRFTIDAIADYDLTSAYSSAMRQLPFFTGTPWVYKGADENISLGEWKRRYLHDFDDWHYVVYVATDEFLNNDQDFLVSWIGAIVGKMNVKNDKGQIDYISYAKYDSGECRIFKREVVNCPVTSDTIKWIDSLSKPVREELYKKLIVCSAIGYKRNRKNVDWESINLGDMLINQLQEKRAHYKKEFKDTNDKKYDSMQELFKLVINTVYGVMCSRHFVTSNVVVANQITQIIRLGMYLMEKGLNLQGSITDGCMGSLNKVVYPLENRNIQIDKLTSLYSLNSKELNQKLHLRLGALDNAKHIDLSSWMNTGKIDDDGKPIYKPVLTVTYSDHVEIVTSAIEWINEKAWNHLRFLFPDFHYLFDFLKIEVKDVYDSCVYHGAANYELLNPYKSRYAMRGYSGKKGVHHGIHYDVENDCLIKTDDYKNDMLPKMFLSRLHDNKVEKMPPFAKTSILKSKDYVNRNFVERSELICGDNIVEIGLPNHFSLSQFTFSTIGQHEKWLWAQNKLKKVYGESFEIFFTDSTGKIDYDRMIKECCDLINQGDDKPIKHFAKRYKVDKNVSNRYRTKLKASEFRNTAVFTIIEKDEFEKDEFETNYNPLED